MRPQVCTRVIRPFDLGTSFPAPLSTIQRPRPRNGGIEGNKGGLRFSRFSFQF